MTRPTLPPLAPAIALILFVFGVQVAVADNVRPVLTIDTPMSPPEWALLERQLLEANTAACEEFFRTYFDERGWLLCVERWGGDDGPDDAIENCLHWPILHALGASDSILKSYKAAWEGHLRQYTLARTVEVPMARDGMYYKEFPVQFDWLHNAEGLTVFCLQGLGDPNDPLLLRRTQRYAGFYLNDDPQAPNYDAQHRIIRSMFNGSRGPLLRPATGLDWAGDPIEIENRFSLGHGERSYEEMLDHFKDYNDIVGDHPQNLLATALATNAFMLSGDDRYRDWVLEYVSVWVERMVTNNFIIPTKIGLDGAIGGPDGKWYGGVYGWGFTVEVPQTGALSDRNTHYLGLPGFMNAYLLTGDDRYLDAWRRQIATINAQVRMIDGKPQYPRMFGDAGWYSFSPQKYSIGTEEIAFLTMKPEDVELVRNTAWWSYLDEKNDTYPEQALRADLEQLRRKVQGMRHDPTTPDTRLADDPMKFSPASIGSLVRLMLGGLPTNKQGLVLHSRLRYFDPAQRRAGLPDGCAALVEKLTADSTTVTLVNTDQLAARDVTIQAGGNAEHSFESLEVQGRAIDINSRSVTVRLEPGCGARLTLSTHRYSQRPALTFPWIRP